tara:strand:+ start:414 stop:722 length:309 start_codon:yes stop_codon:yes gene_type:complete
MKEETNTETNTVKPGRPWDILGYYETYTAAATARAEIVAEWEVGKKEGMESKIKLRRLPHRFVVKTRAPFNPAAPPGKTKKKPKKKNEELKFGSETPKEQLV